MASSKIIAALESLPRQVLFPHSQGVPSWNRIYVSKWQKPLEPVQKNSMIGDQDMEDECVTTISNLNS